MNKVSVPRKLFFLNVGENPPKPKPGSNWVDRRQWSACRYHGFISAGQDIIYSRQLNLLNKGDIVAAYITGSGYVGIGKITSIAVPINNFIMKGETLKNKSGVKDLLFENSNNLNSEYVVGIEWLKTVEKANAYWEKNQGLYASRLIVCSLENQPITIAFIEKKFKIEFV